MAENKEKQGTSCCGCGGFTVRVQPTEKSVTICVQTDDGEKAGMVKRMAKCCEAKQEASDSKEKDA